MVFDNNKLGSYIQKLMLIVIDKEQDNDVIQLAWDELRRLNTDLNEFLTTNKEDVFEKVQRKAIKKQLLQEEQENVSDK
jgi:hypothetical protein